MAIEETRETTKREQLDEESFGIVERAESLAMTARRIEEHLLAGEAPPAADSMPEPLGYADMTLARYGRIAHAFEQAEQTLARVEAQFRGRDTDMNSSSWASVDATHTA